MHQQPPKTPLFASTSPANPSSWTRRELDRVPRPTSTQPRPPGRMAVGCTRVMTPGAGERKGRGVELGPLISGSATVAYRKAAAREQAGSAPLNQGRGASVMRSRNASLPPRDHHALLDWPASSTGSRTGFRRGEADVKQRPTDARLPVKSLNVTPCLPARRRLQSASRPGERRGTCRRPPRRRADRQAGRSRCCPIRRAR